jgi:hypothetical protein
MLGPYKNVKIMKMLALYGIEMLALYQNVGALLKC